MAKLVTSSSGFLLSNYIVNMAPKISKQPKIPRKCLLSKHDPSHIFEIGVDECARGPMFGRVYTAAAVLDDNFDHTLMCDSKKIHSQKKFLELATYIKQHAVAWSINYKEPWEIDTLNIRQAVLTSMTDSIEGVIQKLDPKLKEHGHIIKDSCFIMVDGNDFPGYKDIPYITIEKGDNTYSSIAAASILAKQAHDQYILDMCDKIPQLSERYGLNKNMGYGTKIHMDGIREYGITQWHRKSFGICKSAKYSPLDDII